jgi:hypothetical protein
MLALALTAALLAQAVPAPATPQQVTPAAADRPASSLRATIRIAFAKIDAAAGSAGPFAAFGPLIVQMLTPEGAADIHYTISADAMRAEIEGRIGPLPRGTIVLQHIGEPSMRVLNPAQKTWYEIPAGQNLGMLLGTPDVDIQPTGEHATIAGQPADRFRFTETLHVPPPQGVALPQDFPREIQFTGDLWSTDALAGSTYGAIAKTMQTFAAIPGIEALTAGGRFPLRLALRSDLLDRAAFAVPSDYQKVQPPAGGGV